MPPKTQPTRPSRVVKKGASTRTSKQGKRGGMLSTSEHSTRSESMQRMNSFKNPKPSPARMNSLGGSLHTPRSAAPPGKRPVMPKKASSVRSLGGSSTHNPRSSLGGSSSHNPTRPLPSRMNSLGNPSGATTAKKKNSIRRTNSLGSDVSPIKKKKKTKQPKKKNSLGSLESNGNNNNVKPSPVRIKKPSLRKAASKKSLPDPPTVSNDHHYHHTVKENPVSKRTRLTRWGFGGSHSSEENDQYGDSERGQLSLAALRNNSSKGGGASSTRDLYNVDEFSDNSSSEWDGKESQMGNLTHFPDDTWWQSCLRHFRILQPHPNEGRTRRTVRRLIWATLIFDVLVAIVTIATFSGTVTMCCNQVTMASIPYIDWNLFITVISYVYLVGIFLEIHPVVREGPIPWNLLNPIFGSLLSFAVFVDDSKAEAIGIWVCELSSVILEAVTYLKLKKLYQREERRLEKLDNALKGDQDALYRKGGQYKQNAYLRERRMLRIEHNENQSKLRYHFVGVSVNFVLVLLTLLLMILVARGRGMCLVAGEGLDLFHPDQRSRCFECKDLTDGWKQQCQVCQEGPHADPNLNDPIQCFYPYF